MNRTRKITFRVSDYENRLIEAKAARVKTRVSAYCRAAVLGKEVVYIDGLRELLPELNRMGNNLNQITVLLRQGHITNPIFSAHKLEFDALVTDLNKRLRGGEAA